MGKLVAQNKWLLGQHCRCLSAWVIDYLTPLLLAETLDYYLAASLPPCRRLSTAGWMLGGPGFMARNFAAGSLVWRWLPEPEFCAAGDELFQGSLAKQGGRENLRHCTCANGCTERIQHLPFSYHVKAKTAICIMRSPAMWIPCARFGQPAAGSGILGADDRRWR
ncbi:MAG: hypothetical protein V8Q82_06795 [Christensenellales bacterium]